MSNNVVFSLVFMYMVMHCVLASPSLPSSSECCTVLDITWPDAPLNVSNPFDPNVITVTATTTMSDGVRVWNGFYYQSYTRHRDDDGKEVLEQDGEPVWKFRIIPQIKGIMKVTLSYRYNNVNGSAGPYSVVIDDGDDGDGCGQPVVAPNNQYFMTLIDRKPLFLIGENVCWSDASGTFYYDDYFNKLHKHKVNYSRIWLGPFDLFSLETKERGVGNIDLQNAWRADYVLNLADSLGIYVQLCSESFNALRDIEPFNMWHNNPYNVVNGGKCRTPSDFFVNPSAKFAFKNRLRYITSRYAYTHVLAYELFNEVDLVSQYNQSAVCDWHSEMAEFIRSSTPISRMVTSSFSDPDGSRCISSLPGIDYTNTHVYNDKDLSDNVFYYSFSKISLYRKPSFVAETGMPEPAGDPQGIGLHNALWSGIVGGSGSGSVWWWDTWVGPNDLYHHYDAPVAYMSYIVSKYASYYTNGSWISNQIKCPSDNECIIRYRQNDNVTMMWIVNINSTWYNDQHHIPVHDIPYMIFNINVKSKGKYAIIWIDSYSGVEISRSYGDGGGGDVLTVTSVPFTRDVAALIEIYN